VRGKHGTLVGGTLLECGGRVLGAQAIHPRLFLFPFLGQQLRVPFQKGVMKLGWK
ncbi:Uncharacterized protein DAT39_012588, partial [Clarias magur]